MEADYIIVGAGSAGCATAFRLCEAGHRVIVLEYGGSDRSPLIQMPGALSYPMNCLLYTSPSPRDYAASRMPSSA